MSLWSLYHLLEWHIGIKWLLASDKRLESGESSCEGRQILLHIKNTYVVLKATKKKYLILLIDKNTSLLLYTHRGKTTSKLDLLVFLLLFKAVNYQNNFGKSLSYRYFCPSPKMHFCLRDGRCLSTILPCRNRNQLLCISYFQLILKQNKKQNHYLILPFSHLSSEVLARSGAVRTCIQWL